MLTTEIVKSRQLLFALAVLISGLGAVDSHAGRNNNAGIIPNVALPHGNSYGEWGAAWWQWAASTSTAESPVLDTTGEFCHVNQPGQGVFFLAGTFGTEEVRSCTIPFGQMLLIPIINTVVWAPESCSDEATCRTAVDESVALMDILEVEIDGVAVQDLSRYRADSGPFALDLQPGTFYVELGMDPGLREPAVSDGFYLMLAPLSPGEHVIHFRGGASALSFETEVTYFLTIEGPPRGRDGD